ncbi:hypothetical protein AB833_31465 [Chromatiales bacterium (ex Bugula neritina AB1)]|nr:hypothetical protein AB833_31465 [Chromatiales bacterium (ex Bugula neritina AB1)]
MHHIFIAMFISALLLLANDSLSDETGEDQSSMSIFSEIKNAFTSGFTSAYTKEINAEHFKGAMVDAVGTCQPVLDIV